MFAHPASPGFAVQCALQTLPPATRCVQPNPMFVRWTTHVRGTDAPPRVLQPGARAARSQSSRRPAIPAASRVLPPTIRPTPSDDEPIVWARNPGDPFWPVRMCSATVPPGAFRVTCVQLLRQVVHP